MDLDVKAVLMRFIDSVKAAFAGMSVGFREERHIRFHIFMMCGVVLAGLILQLTSYEWLAIWLVMGFVLATELINSAIERVTDLVVGNRFDGQAKKVKDLAASSVLVAASIAIVVGIIVFLPKIIHLFH